MMADLSERLARLPAAKRAQLERRLLERQRAARIPRRTDEGSAPLSYAQRGMWFLDRWQPGSVLYGVRSTFRLSGPLDVPAMRRALNAVVARHEILRTTFEEVDGRPVQRVAPAVTLPLPVVDLRGMSPEPLLEAEAGHPFDLAGGPMLRAALLVIGDEEHLLLLSLHHIVADGWSQAVLVRELSEHYAAYRQGRPPAVPDLPLQYADFAAWQDRSVGDGELAEQLHWWTARLAGSPQVLAMPSDRTRPAVPSYRGGNLDLRIPPEVTAELRALGRREGATLHMTLLSALQVLLYRYTGQNDVVVGSPIAGRVSGDLENLIGCFVNTLALRTDLSGEPAFVELLGRVREGTLAAYAHQALPFERLVEELPVQRGAGHTPVYQVMFVMENTPPASWDLPGVTVKPWRVTSPALQFDLSMAIRDDDESLVATLDYSTDLFDEPTVSRFLSHFSTLLSGICRDPGRPISELPLATPQEERVALVDWNATPPPGRGDLVGLFEERARRMPDATAVAHLDERVSYGALNERANQVAHALLKRGIGDGSRVGLSGDWTPDLVAGLLGVLKAGAAYVPMDPEYPPARLAGLREDAGVSLVLTQDRWRDRHGDADVLCLETDARDLPEDNPPGSADDRSLAYVIFTSGSTGRPKGVGVPRGAVVAYSAAIRETLGQVEGWSFGFLAAPGTDLGNTAIFPSLLHGGCLTLLSRECAMDGHAYADAVARTPLDVLKTTPTQMRMLLAQAPAAQVLPAQWLILGGEPVAPELWRELSVAGSCRLLCHYGPTEATVGCVTYHGPAPATATVPIGRPLAGTRVYVLDDNLKPVPPGLPGELCLAGAQLARGYVGRPGLTAERFVPDPYGGDGGRLYRTGDLARWTGEGLLEFLGRRDQQVKVRGHRVELGEIEAALRAHPQVRDAAVTVWEPEPGDTRLVAHVVGGVGGQALREFAAARLPAHMVPAVVVPLDALPMTPNGKLDRARLPKPEDHAAPLVAGLMHEPMLDLLSDIWGEVLRTEVRIGPDTDFFAAGGHSLLAAQVVARVRALLGVELPVRALFDAPTLRAFARRASIAGAAEPVAAIEPARRNGPIPLSSAQRRLWFIDQLDPTGTVHIVAIALDLDGALRVGALHAAVEALRRRHESLRTTFRRSGGRLEQVISAYEPAPLPLIDLSGLGPDGVGEAAQRLVEADAARPFDLESGPLLRVTLLRLGHDRHTLLVMLHHIVTDAWSIDLLLGELWELYQSRDLAPMQIQYADYAIWEHDRLAAGALKQAEEYWTGQLAGAPGVLDLAAGRPRSAGQVFSSETAPFEMPADEVVAFSRREGVTPFMTVLAAYLVLLRRRAGYPDLVIGTDTANRDRVEVERLIGFFTNLVVLRAHVRGDETVRELLAEVRRVLLDAYTHQELPFDRLVELVRPERLPDRAPLFQVEITFQRATDRMPGPPGLTVRPRRLHGAVTTLDLSLHVVQTETLLYGGLTYNAGLFSAATARRLSGELRMLLDAMVSEPDRRVDELAARAEQAFSRERLSAARATFDGLTPDGG
ncbi:amino acid adenylation domain-containing protein [Streptosporangium sp. CA-135522]|uniref:amino acid adenylation domain-containing protein n=1 Tax=Streptosporangium sp. CA-135522 TaxID=3240072 RepID=UPI003D8B4C41